MKNAWTQDPKLYNLGSLSLGLHMQPANLPYLICLCLQWREDRKPPALRPGISTPHLVVESKGATFY